MFLQRQHYKDKAQRTHTVNSPFLTSREISGATGKKRSPFQSVMSLGRSRNSPDTRYNYSNIRHSASYQYPFNCGSLIFMKKPIF